MSKTSESTSSAVAVSARDWGWRHSTRREFALRHVDFDIRPGEHVLLLGASGAGKSTLMAALAGVLGGDDEGEEEGALTLDGVKPSAARGRAGLVLQDPDSQIILERLGDDAAFGCENLDVPREETWDRVRDSLGIVGLGALDLARSTGHLSGGQRQRLALAGVLSMHPGLLLLDEPTANLDPEGVREVHDAVRHVLEQGHETMVVVEHHIDVWLDLIDRVIVLGKPDADDDAGGVIVDGTPDEVFATMGDVLAEGGAWVPGRAIPMQYRDPQPVRPVQDDARPEPADAPGAPAAASAADAPAGPILYTQDLAFGRGTPLGEHVNLGFDGGEIYAMMGPNGAGKSTMALTLAGLLEPLEGHVRVRADLAPAGKGDEPRAWKSRELLGRVGMVFQEPEHQFVTSSVRDEVALGPKSMGKGQDEAYLIADRMLDRLGLARFAKANPYTLSGGEKRRLSVASMLAAAPKVLIMDEPTFGQDFATWTEMVKLIAMARDEGSAVIMVTHDEALVEALGAKRILFHERGLAESPAGATGGAEAPAPAAEPSGASDGARQASPEPASGLTIAAQEAQSAASGGTVVVSAQTERNEPVKAASPSWFVARLNPVSRFVMALLLSVPLFFSLDVVSATVALGIELVLLWIGGVDPITVCRKTWPVWIAACGGLLSVLMYGKTSGATLFQWGVIHVSEGSVYLAIATFLRVLAIAIPSVVLAFGLDPTDLADGLVQVAHLSPRFVYGGLAGMRMFTLLQDDWRALGLSRRSRGLGDDNAIKRAMSQAFGLLVLSIRRATKLATAMEARGFGGSTPRSSARVSSLHRIDWVSYVIGIVVPVIALAAAIATGLWSQPMITS